MNDSLLVVHEKHYEKNPYIRDLVQTIEIDSKKSFIGKTTQNLIDLDTGELLPQEVLVLGEKKFVDKTQFMKVYTEGVSRIFGLTKSEEKVLYNYIYQIVPKDKDWFMFQLGDCKEKTNLKSKSSIYTALKGLTNKQLICKAEFAGKYFINPTVFFNGNRITLMQTYYLQEFKQLK
jgi:hypothetical protein